MEALERTAPAPLAGVRPIAPATIDRHEPPPKLLFLVTEDWYFWSHRLPVARAAREAGFEVLVATRVRQHGERIREEGFELRALGWRRRGDGLLGHGRAFAEIAALYRRERPDIVHHVALKPILFGGLAARLVGSHGARPAQVAAVTGLGSGLAPTTLLGRVGRPSLAWALRRATAGAPIIVQNPEDGGALVRSGIDPARIVLIPGSGVDPEHFAPLPEPVSSLITVALVGRMLHSKGVLDAAAAVRRLRAQGLAIELLLAGAPDPDNRDSLDEPALRALAAEPGITWLGQVEDVRSVWRRAAIAVFPTSYGEGVPKALLEAASCARPVIASDMPGCREAVRHGETGLLTPPADTGALVDALAMLAGDPERRQAMGRAGRNLIEREFGEIRVVRQTMALYRRLLCERAME